MRSLVLCVCGLYLLYFILHIATMNQHEVECNNCGATLNRSTPENVSWCDECPIGLCVEGRALYILKNEDETFLPKFNSHVETCVVCNDYLDRSNNDSP